jgi:SAM-dependent methyltransferase
MVRLHAFAGSTAYWDERYRQGGTSGPGSYGETAAYKAEFVNWFVEEHAIRAVVELGCGDGHQLSLFRFPSYLGVDVSATAVERCRALFEDDGTKNFAMYSPGTKLPEASGSELGLSLDVIFHLVEDHLFDTYMQDLFSVATQFVIIYSTNHNEWTAWPFVRHRAFSEWIDANALDWRLCDQVPSPQPGLFLDFFVYGRR